MVHLIIVEAITEYFATIPSSHRSLILVGALTVFFLVENLFPFFKTKYNKATHTGINLFFTATTVIINFTMAFLLVLSSDWVGNSGIGLLQWVDLPLWAAMIVGLMIMDLVGAWLPHFVEHKIWWLWQFHLVHHSDQNVDTTSANRHHPGESVVRFIFTCLAVIVAGAPIWLIFLYQSLSLILSQFNHSNLTFPEAVDKVLRQVICTPRMHRIHHHYRQPYSDRNYGNIFSFWDRLFGTYVAVDNKKLVYGVDTYMNPKEASALKELLLMPFRGYRKSIQYDEEEKL